MNCKSLAFICGFRGRGLVINIIFNNTDFCILGYYPMSDKLKNIHRIFFNKYPKKKLFNATPHYGTSEVSLQNHLC